MTTAQHIRSIVLSALFAVATASASMAGGYLPTSSGSANAQTLTLHNVWQQSDLLGEQIMFMAGGGLTNTGPATLSVNGFPAANVYRMTQGQLVPLGGAEIEGGMFEEVRWDGTEFILLTNYAGTDPPGTLKAADYLTADPGYVLAYGQCLSEAAYPALFAKVSTIHNTADGCSAGTFGLPDTRGALLAGLDNLGGTAANRITSAISGVAGTTLGATGGSQGYAGGIAQTYLRSFNFPTASLAGGEANNWYYNTSPGGAGTLALTAAGYGGNGNQASVSGTVTVSSGGSGTAFPTLPYVLMIVDEMKL